LSPEEDMDQTHVAQSAPELRDVFGDSDEEEPAGYGVQHDMEQQPVILLCIVFMFPIYNCIP